MSNIRASDAVEHAYNRYAEKWYFLGQGHTAHMVPGKQHMSMLPAALMRNCFHGPFLHVLHGRLQRAVCRRLLGLSGQQMLATHHMSAF